MPIINLTDIKKEYSVGEDIISAVDVPSLSIEKGEFVSIIGHSGSGKTTLLSIMGGILKPTSGKMLYKETDVYELNENDVSMYRARNVGYIFQFASLLPVLTAKENLLLPTLFAGGCDSEKEQKAEEYLRLVGLSDKVNSYPSQLSGGQQRRVAIARALMNDPDIILADEPTGDLDEETEADVMRFIKKINNEKGITFVLVTHSKELASDASRKFKMTRGTIEEL